MSLYFLFFFLLSAFYFFGAKWLFRKMTWGYRGLLMIGINGVYLCLFFGFGLLYWEVG